MSVLGFVTKLSSLLSNYLPKKYCFPSELISSDNLVPVIEFTANTKDQLGVIMGDTVMLPCPGNLTFTNSAQYDQANLGGLGGALTGAAGNRSLNELGSYFNQIVAENKGGIGINVASLALKKLTLGAIDAEYASKIVVNPNAATTFITNGIRNFSFSFKLVPRNKTDSDLARNIANLFQRNVYAGNLDKGERSYFLDYPPIWTIKFFVPKPKPSKIQTKEFPPMEENRYIPRIFTCYLQTANIVYNANSGSTFYADGAPIELDISLTFQETRQLFKSDLEKLADYSYSVTLKNNSGVFTKA